MINVYITASSVKKGFPEIKAMHLVKIRRVGNMETLLDHAIDNFDSFSVSRQEHHPLFVYRDQIMQAIATLSESNRIAHIDIDGQLTIMVNMLMNEEIR